MTSHPPSTSSLKKNRISYKPWGTYGGKDVFLFKLENASGAFVEITNYGATIVSMVDKRVLATYEIAAAKRQGIAVAEAKDGGCLVCHVRMRPQMFNEVRRGENLIQCESCMRILYFVPQTTATSPS